MDKKIVFISSHAPFNSSGEPIANTGNAIPKYLKEKRIPFTCIFHSLNGGTKSEIIRFDGEKEIKTKSNILTSRNLLLKSIQELFITFVWINKYNKIKIFIGIDPLNALWGILLKLASKTEKVIFYTADYTHTRFNNKILNIVYHMIDRAVLKYSDYCWAVSSKIQKIRIKQGLPNKKNIIVPNAPYLKDRSKPSFKKKNPFSLVLVSTILKGMEFSNLFKVISKLSIKYPQLKLTIVGTKDLDNKIINNNIVLIPYLTHEDLVKLLNESGIGLAIYKITKDNSWVTFCDPMKVRDYLASACPVIVSDFVAISEDINNHKLGYSVKFDSYKQLSDSIESLISNYKDFSNNARRYALIHSMEKYLDRHLLNVLG